MTTHAPKVIVETLNGPLTEDDFVGDAPRVGSSDKKYSKEDLAAMAKLAEELASKVPSK